MRKVGVRGTQSTRRLRLSIQHLIVSNLGSFHGCRLTALFKRTQLKLRMNGRRSLVESRFCTMVQILYSPTYHLTFVPTIKPILIPDGITGGVERSCSVRYSRANFFATSVITRC